MCREFESHAEYWMQGSALPTIDDLAVLTLIFFIKTDNIIDIESMNECRSGDRK